MNRPGAGWSPGPRHPARRCWRRVRVTRVAGDIVEITQEGGLVSRYIGLARLAPDIAGGATVIRGAVIGQTGQMADQASGAHSRNWPSCCCKAASPSTRCPISAPRPRRWPRIHESLIGNIIRIESAGNAAARNPRSTATGLGQFIDSTWLRMMRSYRPDLVVSLSQAELLELRLDPGISRQMVRNLAQENEGYLRQRGHAISAGRWLYLAHFL